MRPYTALSRTTQTSSVTAETGKYILDRLPAHYLRGTPATATSSLQATWIRNTLRRAVAEADAATAQRISPNLVFAFPTISALARAVHEAVHGGDSGARKPEDLWAYVERYSAGFPARPARLVARPPGDGKDVVLITGTTGGFGCDALEHLLRDAGVGRVYAFNRKGSDALKRQRAQFARRGLDGALLDSGKFVMVEAVLHESGFGIEEGLLEEIRQSVTHILLNGELGLRSVARRYLTALGLR